VFKYDNSNEKLTRIVEIPWTTKDGSQPVDVRPKEFKFSSNGIFIAMTILASLGIIAVLKLLMFNWKQRNHWALRKSIPRLNELMLLGALLVYATVILYGLDGQFFEFTDSSLVTCFLRTIFLAVGFTISYGAVLVRATSDIIELYVKMTYSSLLVILGTLLFGLLLLTDAIILIVWFAVDPWKKGQEILEQQGKVIYVREKCQSSDQFWGYSLIVYKFIVFILCLVVTIVQVQVQKSKTTAAPSYADVLACATGLALGFATFGFLFVSDPGLQYGFVSVCLILLVSSVLLLLFGKKVYTVWKGVPEPTVKQRQSTYELTEMDRGELKELRAKSCDLRTLVEKLLLERPISVDGSMADEVCRVVGYIPGQSHAKSAVNPLSSYEKNPQETSHQNSHS
jgi:gamma-aminobutyric acid type B receptor